MLIFFFIYRTIGATDNRLVQVCSLGDEGWHNFHHAFPWDYRASELWGYDAGISVSFIEFCARRGWTYNLKQTCSKVVARRRQKTGDLSCNVWGWHDENKDLADVAATKVSFKK